MSEFTHKGYGRIYCASADDVQKVHDIIKAIDPSEYEGYMPKELVAPFSEYPAVVYLHKFSDMDMDMVTAICWKRGLRIWVLDAGHTQFYTDKTIKELP